MLPIVRVLETEGVVVGFICAAVPPDQGGCRRLPDFGYIAASSAGNANADRW